MKYKKNNIALNMKNNIKISPTGNNPYYLNVSSTVKQLSNDSYTNSKLSLISISANRIIIIDNEVKKSYETNNK